MPQKPAVFICVGLMLSASGLQAADAATPPADPTNPPTAPTGSVYAPADPGFRERRLYNYLRDPDLVPIRSLLVDKEMPIVGIRWGADLLFDTPLNSEPDGADAGFREAKLIFYRGFGKDLSAKVTANYNDVGDFEIGDSYFVYSGWDNYVATLGVFKPAFSLEAVSKRTGLTFMERALPVDSLAFRRSGGISILRRTTRSILDAGLYFFDPRDEGLREAGQALILHYVHAPLNSDRLLSSVLGREVWIGASLSYRVNADSSGTRFRSRPELGVVDDYFVDTGEIEGADRILRFGLEASKVANAFSWQAEILGTRVKRDNFRDAQFIGGYVFASWFLTGESRNYDAASGDYLPVAPNAPLGHGGWGAFELAVRASTVDLNDEDVTGGQEKNLSFGINWYLTSAFRVQANIVKVLDVKRPGSEFDGRDPLALALRLQWSLR